MPRAAMSVATMTCTCPVEKALMARSRAFWLMLPWSSTAGIPAWTSLRARRRARCLVRVNRMRCPSPEARRRTMPSLAVLSGTIHTR